MRDADLFEQQNTVTLTMAGGEGRTLKPGELIGGSYRLKSLIGQGGMGYVFCAEHTMIGRDYAVKVMAPDHINETNRRRFEVEGRAIAALDHANIVKVYNMGLDRDDCPFIVMDLLVGTSLFDEIKSGRQMELAEIISILCQIADGLGYAHAKGIVHRDVKPSNIMLIGGPGGKPSVRLVDFGLAKLVADEKSGRQNLTNTGEVFGSPYYMSPEQCLGTKIDNRSDIYSLGCTFYEMLMGKPPFSGQTALETVFMHSNAAVPEIEGRFAGSQTERRLNLLLKRMMAKKPEDRYQNMGQLVHDLERIAANKEIVRLEGGGNQASRQEQQSRRSVTEEAEQTEAPIMVQRSSAEKLILSVAVVLAIGVALYAVFKLGSKPVVGASSLVARLNVAASQVNAKAAGGLKPQSEQTEADAATNFPISVLDVLSQKEMVKTKLGRLYSNKEYKLAHEELEHAAPITIEKAGSERVIHFPKHKIGSVLVDYRNIGEAVGDFKVPDHGSLQLMIDWERDIQDLLNSFIYRRIDRNIFSSLFIKNTQQAIFDDKGNKSDLIESSLLDILDHASHWTHMIHLKLEGFEALRGDKRLLDCLDRFPELYSFSAPGRQIDMRQLSHTSFIKRLLRLELDKEEDIDILFPAMAADSKITFLQINRTTPSPEGLEFLQRWPHLQTLQMRNCKLTRKHIEVLSKLPKLENLDLGDYRPSIEDLQTLASSHSLQNVYLLAVEFDARAQKEMSSKLSRLKFKDE